MAELIVALDFNKAEDALGMAMLLQPQVKWFKVGLELFTASGPGIVRALKYMDASVFLDLKIYDIPNTAIKAALAASRLEVDMLTVHCQGGKRMCCGVVEALKQHHMPDMKVIGVTSLTSFEAGEMPGIQESPAEFGRHLAEMAKSWDLAGIVCSAQELNLINNSNSDFIYVCPGIRQSCTTNKDDQRRVMTPYAAAKAGATYLVMGRPITQSSDPLKAVKEALYEIKAGTDAIEATVKDNKKKYK